MTDDQVLDVAGVPLEHVEGWRHRGRVGDLDVVLDIDPKPPWDWICSATRAGQVLHEARSSGEAQDATEALTAWLRSKGLCPEETKPMKTKPAAEAAPTNDAATGTAVAEPLETLAAIAPEDAVSVLRVPLEQIEEDPRNPRKTFDGIEELAASIRAHDVVEPVLVRPISRPDGAAFRLIAGARRVRAARLADRATVPAIVRDVDDATALELMIVENSHRKDVPPLEEADGYVVLRDELKLTPEAIAARTGHSYWHVMRRLKLAELIAAGREALHAGRISHTTAMRLARISDKETQKKALDDGLAQSRWTGTGQRPLNDDEWKKLILDHLATSLKDAPFDITDAKLVRRAGPCTGCPHRAGNSPGLFEDVADADTCTKRSCYDAKVAAAATRKLDEYRERGIDVVPTGTVFRVEEHLQDDFTKHGSRLVLLDEKADPSDYSAHAKTWRQLLGDKVPEKPSAAVQAPSGKVVEVYDRTALAAVARKAKIPVGRPAPRSSSGPKRDPEAERKAALEEKVAEEVRDRITAHVLAEAPKLYEKDRKAFLRTLVECLTKCCPEGTQAAHERRKLGGGYGAFEKKIAALAAKLGERDLIGLAAEILHGDEIAYHGGEASHLQCVLKTRPKDIEAAVRKELALTEEQAKVSPPAKGKKPAKGAKAKRAGAARGKNSWASMTPEQKAARVRTMLAGRGQRPAKGS